MKSHRSRQTAIGSPRQRRDRLRAQGSAKAGGPRPPRGPASLGRQGPKPISIASRNKIQQRKARPPPLRKRPSKRIDCAEGRQGAFVKGTRERSAPASAETTRARAARRGAASAGEDRRPSAPLCAARRPQSAPGSSMLRARYRRSGTRLTKSSVHRTRSVGASERNQSLSTSHSSFENTSTMKRMLSLTAT